MTYNVLKRSERNYRIIMDLYSLHKKEKGKNYENGKVLGL